MRVRVLDLDGSIGCQPLFSQRAQANRVALRGWGPMIRLACSWRRFRNFERHFTRLVGAERDREPHLTFYGSGDFHHVTLALLRRLQSPFNLLVLDNHPDWMQGLPFLHCGSWLYHAA